MIRFARLTAAASIGALAFAAAACTPAETEADRNTDTTTIVEREVPSAPVVVEREVAVPTAPVVVEDRRDGLEVETTNR